MLSKILVCYIYYDLKGRRNNVSSDLEPKSRYKVGWTHLEVILLKSKEKRSFFGHKISKIRSNFNLMYYFEEGEFMRHTNGHPHSLKLKS